MTHSGGLIAIMRVKLVSSHHEDPDGHHEGNHEGQAGDYEDHDGDHCGNYEAQGGHADIRYDEEMTKVRAGH